MNDLSHARRHLESENLAFVIVRDNLVLAQGAHDGVGELLAAIDKLGGQTSGASLADRVVGKAVALIVLGAGIVAVYTPLASEAAAEVFRSNGVFWQARTIVPQILNRRGNGPCPLEQLTHPLHDPAVAVVKLREFIALRAVPPVDPTSPI
ncbi:MAG: DUF1893 domain-containing protein [Lacunisphaera sp.]|nr:DUF1893 domain-containing protein [Lacunisphaera sp.]